MFSSTIYVLRLFFQDARIRTEAAIEAQRAEVVDYKEKLIKQAEMRKEFLQINAQLKDIKTIEKELIKIEILQVLVYKYIILGMYFMMYICRCSVVGGV